MRILSKVKSLTSRQYFSHYMSMGDLRASSPHVNSPICPIIKLVQDFMAALITCKSDGESMKKEITILHFRRSMGPLRTGNSHASSRNGQNRILLRFYDCPYYLKFWQHFFYYTSMGDLIASNSHANSQICPNIKLVLDLITCQSENDSIKNEIAIVRRVFSEV